VSNIPEDCILPEFVLGPEGSIDIVTKLWAVALTTLGSVPEKEKDVGTSY
jgi:hypothetical protein